MQPETKPPVAAHAALPSPQSDPRIIDSSLYRFAGAFVTISKVRDTNTQADPQKIKSVPVVAKNCFL